MVEDVASQRLGVRPFKSFASSARAGPKVAEGLVETLDLAGGFSAGGV